MYRQLEALQYKLALARIDALLTELKRLDDKMILTEVHLLESRVYRGIGNLSKAKVSPWSAIPVTSIQSPYIL
jgi:26S proteasome regulatory subunit N6